MFRPMSAAFAASLACASPALGGDKAIIRTLTDIAAGADRHDWPWVEAAFAETVTTDYTSLWGGDPVTQPRGALVSGWAAFLPGFDATHHRVTNHSITMRTDDTATAEADFTATHRIHDGLWVLGGRYTYGLVKQDARWVVTDLTMLAVWETGDRGLVGQAAARGGVTE